MESSNQCRVERGQLVRVAREDLKEYAPLLRVDIAEYLLCLVPIGGNSMLPVRKDMRAHRRSVIMRVEY